MTFSLPPEAAQWRDKVRQFVDSELQPFELEAEMHEGRIPEAARKAHEKTCIAMGVTRMDVPKERGGLALPILTQTAIVEQFGRVTNALGWCYGEAQGWMFEAFNEEQVARIVMPVTRGEIHLCYAITEENAGSDPGAIATEARRKGDSYFISGEKWHVTSHNLASHMIVQAKLGGGEHEGEHCLFVCRADAPGVSIARSPAYTHNYNHHHPVLRFDNVEVPLHDRIGAEGDGMGFTHSWFRRERLMIAARCCGAMARLIEEASEFAKMRVVSGQPIADYQMIQAMLADSVLDLHAARLLTYEAAAEHDRGCDLKSLHARCSIAKLFASEAAFRVADRAVQIFGGRGYMRENVAERFLREVRVDRIWEGTSEIQRLIIARSLLKRGLEGTIGPN
ncbi:acyl-CoA dehydrogenase family protein [Taklimakanibacter lacteus]|uniref:acyl-CoA dehydrogenase family protein n=1 Tax=Taklimakanibacter lacteus TaxID=2268456 RepID=UPI000E66105C